ncbi:uncharacterized protein LOC143029923 isoform X2 [Oratosquilla oratoria]|uniref:uncharacterized protein LOC143029923 isoform X2 n=1 Tax=Oratosquilla oratoria TaxID=337810 RepID=UPI003F759018
MHPGGTRESTMESVVLSIQWMEHQHVFSQAVTKLRKQLMYTDASLACEGKFYKVHKFILSTCSEYFSDIFEWTPCVNPVVVINGISCRDLEFLLDFMYTGVVNVNEPQVSTLLRAAECLRIKGLALSLDNNTEKPSERFPMVPESDDRSDLGSPAKKRKKDDTSRKKVMPMTHSPFPQTSSSMTPSLPPQPHQPQPHQPQPQPPHPQPQQPHPQPQQPHPQPHQPLQQPQQLHPQQPHPQQPQPQPQQPQPQQPQPHQPQQLQPPQPQPQQQLQPQQPQMENLHHSHNSAQPPTQGTFMDQQHHHHQHHQHHQHQHHHQHHNRNPHPNSTLPDVTSHATTSLQQTPPPCVPSPISAPQISIPETPLAPTCPTFHANPLLDAENNITKLEIPDDPEARIPEILEPFVEFTNVKEDSQMNVRTEVQDATVYEFPEGSPVAPKATPPHRSYPPTSGATSLSSSSSTSSLGCVKPKSRSREDKVISPSHHSPVPQPPKPKKSRSSHTKKPSLTIEDLTCKFCGKKCSRVDHLTRHMQKEHDTEPYTCSDCTFKAKTFHELRNHKKIHRPLFKCTHCDFSAQRNDHFIRHLKKMHKIEDMSDKS